MANNEFDPWGEDTDNDGNFADFGNDDLDNDDMNWGSDTSGDSGDDVFGGGDNSFADFDTPDEQGIDESEMFQHQKQSGGFGAKTIGIIVAVALLVMTGIFLFVDGISFTKKEPAVQQPQQSVEQQQGGSDVSQQQTQTKESTGDTAENGSGDSNVSEPEKIVPDKEAEVVPPSDGKMTELPADTQIDYSGSLYETTGTVHNKIKYLEDSQVVYCIQVSAKIGDSSKLINYYCGYNVFSGVQEGDTVTVSYQVVSDTCYSVNTISK